jgi:hypothetical protein
MIGSLAQSFTADSLEKRRANKVAIQEELGWKSIPKPFSIGLVGRMVEQKGLDLILQILERFLSYTDAQFVFWEPVNATTKPSSGRWPAVLPGAHGHLPALQRRALVAASMPGPMPF